MKIIRYGLRHKKENQLITFDVSSNCFGGCDFELELPEKNNKFELSTIWMVGSYEIADQARIVEKQFSSNYLTPKNYFKPEELQVVKLEITID